MVEEIALFYANKRAQKHTGESTGSVNVQFVQMQDANTFFTVEQALLSLPSVASVNVEHISSDVVDFSINLIGDALDFEREISRISQIEALEHVLVEADEAEILPTPMQPFESDNGVALDSESAPSTTPEEAGLEQPVEPQIEEELPVGSSDGELGSQADEGVLIDEVELPLIEMYRFRWVS
jgi:hypothetical protein